MKKKTQELDMMMKQQEEDLVKSLNLNLDVSSSFDEEQLSKKKAPTPSIFDSLFDLNFDKDKDILKIPSPAVNNNNNNNKSDEGKNSSNFSLDSILSLKDKMGDIEKSQEKKKNSRFQFASKSARSNSLYSRYNKTPLSSRGFQKMKSPRLGELKRFASSPEGKRTYQFRSAYLTWCEKLNVTPAPELLKSLKNSLKSQTPFVRLSICHAGIDNTHVQVLVNSLKGNNGINEILLNHNGITDEGAKIIADTLKSNRSITSVELFGNKIGNSCQSDFSDMLAVNKTLKRLKLGDNLIGPEGAASLSKGLKNNSTLTQLHLGGNKIKVEGLKHIASALKNNKALTSLGLRDNAVGPLGMEALSETLKQKNCALSDIQLKGNKILAKGAYYLADALNINRSLKVLELQSNSIGSEGVQLLCKALKKNDSVHALNFNDNDLGDDGAGAVANLLMNNPSITTLGLANNRIRKKGASYLADSLKNSKSAVTGLDLGNNEIGNGGAVSLSHALKYNSVLTSLDLRSCDIHLKGILSLAQMASVNTTLRHLDLGANYAKNQGAISWSQVLSKNTTLTRLCLTDNQIYNEGGEALARALQKNFTLRNFSYGGQGPSANRIDSTIRRVIDSIVAENKRSWESSNSKESPKKYPSRKMSPRLIKGSRNIDISNIRYNRSRTSSLPADKKGRYGIPNWFSSYDGSSLNGINKKELESQLAYLFQKRLLKAENPKFPGCYFIGHIANTMSKIFPETNYDEVQLVHFAYNNSNYYVHLSPEMVKTQIKYVGSSNQQRRNSGLRKPRRRSSFKNNNNNNSRMSFQKTNSLSPQSKKRSNSSWNKPNSNKRFQNVNSTVDVNGYPSLQFKQPRTYIRSKYFGAIGSERRNFLPSRTKKSNDFDFSSLEESLKSIKF